MPSKRLSMNKLNFDEIKTPIHLFYDTRLFLYFPSTKEYFLILSKH